MDSAIRYITHYYNAIGKPAKKQCIALERGYHGSSSTGAGLTALANFHRNFDLPLRWQHHISSPYPYRSDLEGDDAAIIARSVQQLKDRVAELGADNVAAFFCEPIQGSGGVIVPPVGWLKAMRQACDELDILLVADEVITAFGRTGPMFACEAEGGMADGAAADAGIGHGATYSGHPVSAAVGLEVLRLYTEGGILANGQKVAARFDAGLAGLADHPLVGDTRGRGLLGAIELVADKGTKARFDPALKVADRLFNDGYANGVIFRAFADNIIGLAPALCATDAEMDEIFARIRKTLDGLLEQADIRAALG